MASAVVSSPPASAQLPAAKPGIDCASSSPAAALAAQRRSNLALFYDLGLIAVDGRVYEWRADGQARALKTAAAFVHVAVNAQQGHGIDNQNRAWRWTAGSDQLTLLLENVAYLAAGDSGLLAIRCDGSLWQRQSAHSTWSRIADAAIHAWVGDSADYFIDLAGGLHVSGKAHRGQYGNGQLEDTPGWVRVADRALAVYAHTGHAVYLRQDGAVLGTGGNRFGPLGTHGYGDKATHWGVIFDNTRSLATGASHTLAVQPDGSLWSWGSADGLKPKRVLENVTAAVGGSSANLAQTRDGAVWHWRVGAKPQKLALVP